VKSGRRPLCWSASPCFVVARGYWDGSTFHAHPSTANRGLRGGLLFGHRNDGEASNFTIVLTGSAMWRAESATVRSLVTEQIIKHRLKRRSVCQNGRTPGPTRSEHLSAQLDTAEANLARDESIRKWRINLNGYIHCKNKACAPETGRYAESEGTHKKRRYQAMAAIEYARTELSYTKLVAPFDGGRRQRRLESATSFTRATTRGVPDRAKWLGRHSTRFSDQR